MRSGVFFEIDGVLTTSRAENGVQTFPQSVSELQMNRAAMAPLAELKSAGYVLMATVNLTELAGGSMSRRESDRFLSLLRQTFDLDDVLTCPHEEDDDCPCRKPKPGLLIEARFTWHLDLDHSFVISDKWQDAEAARNAGCTSLLVDSPWIGRGHRDVVVSDVSAAVKKLLQFQPARRVMVA